MLLGNKEEEMLEITEEQFKNFDEKNRAIILKYIAQGLVKFVKKDKKEEKKNTLDTLIYY